MWKTVFFLLFYMRVAKLGLCEEKTQIEGILEKGTEGNI